MVTRRLNASITVSAKLPHGVEMIVQIIGVRLMVPTAPLPNKVASSLSVIGPRTLVLAMRCYNLLVHCSIIRVNRAGLSSTFLISLRLLLKPLSMLLVSLDQLNLLLGALAVRIVVTRISLGCLILQAYLSLG